MTFAKVFGYGGSHGGFILAHLMGQHPELFAGVAIRNAAYDVVSKVGISDIPEWNFVEALGMKSFSWAENFCLKEEEVRNLWQASPIKVVDH